MKLYDTDKQIVTFSAYNYESNQRLQSYYTTQNNKEDRIYRKMFSTPSASYAIFTAKDLDVEEEYTKKLAKIFSGNVLYFTKQSKFPRFKLTGTEYKRCLKPEKADVIIIPDIKNRMSCSCYSSGYRIYENSESYYIVSDYDFKRLFHESDKELLAGLNIFGFNKTFSYIMHTDQIITFDSDDSIYFDLINNKFTKPVITDNMLDIKLSTSLPTITESDVDSINSMLNSPDKSVQELGLKMLTGFNIFETPTLIKAMLMSAYSTCSNSILRGGVAIQKMLNGIDFPRNYVQGFPGWINQLLDKDDKYSEFEQQQIKRLLIPQFKKAYDSLITTNRIEKSPFVPKINLTFE